jgi:hypothetical protein
MNTLPTVYDKRNIGSEHERDSDFFVSATSSLINVPIWFQEK